MRRYFSLYQSGLKVEVSEIIGLIYLVCFLPENRPSAKAGIQKYEDWTPASAGVTDCEGMTGFSGGGGDKLAEDNHLKTQIRSV